MATLEVDKRAILRDVQIREHPMWLRERATVENLIVGMRAINSPAALREWHAAMLEGVRLGEWLVADHRRRIIGLRQGLRDATDPQRRRGGSQMIEAVDYERDTVRALLAALRTLADAAVWRLLDYNRAAVAVLGEGQGARHLATGRGFADEVATLEQLWNEDAVAAVMADLTTCVRHGDLLCVEDWEPRRWRIRECKAGRGGRSRRSKQAARLERLEALLNSGVRPAGDGEDELVIVACPVAIRMHHTALEDLLNAARRDGYAAAWLEDGLLAEVVDQRDVRAATAFDAVAANVRAMAAQGVAEQDVVRYSTDFRRIRDRRATFAGQAPLALLPFAPELTADLCLGGMDLLMTLNCRALERRFARANISARVAQDEEAGQLFMQCERSGRVIDVPAPAREQVLIEGLRLDCLVEIMAWMLDGGPPPGRRRQSAVGLNERAVWDP